MLSHVICYSHCIPIYWWLKTPNFDPHRISNAAPQPVALLPERRATVVEHLGVSLLNSTKKLSVELQWQCQNIYITRIYPWFFCKCTGLKYIIWLITYYIIQVYCIQNMKKCLLYTTCGWKYLEKRESLEWIAGASTLEMLGVLSHLIIHIQMDSYGIIWGVLKS